MKKRSWLVGLILVSPLVLLSVLHGQEPSADATNTVNPSSAPSAPEVAPKKIYPVPPGVTVQRDIPYVPGGGASQSLDLYLPDPCTQPVPLVIFIHGGGWHSGSKEGCPAAYLAQHGYAVAGINYRLVPAAFFPAQLDDCRAALKFLRANAATYHIQPDHVGVWGGSAGGHLAALMGTAAGADFSAMPASVADIGKVDDSLRIQCVVDFYGPSDLTHIMNGHTPNPNNSAIKLLGPFSSGDDLMAKAQWASPVTYVRGDNAPFLIQHGDADKTVPMAQSQELADALQKAGVEETFTIMPGAVHAGAAFYTPENHQTVLAFFDQHLKPAK